MKRGTSGQARVGRGHDHGGQGAYCGWTVLLSIFVYTGLKSGSHMWMWWVLAEGLLGVALIAARHSQACPRGLCGLRGD